MNTSTPVTESFGRLTVITWTDTQGISINVFTAGTRNSLLSAVYPHADREAAKAWYRTVRDAGLAGRPAWQIEAMVSALIDASVAVDEAEQDLIGSINATLDQAKPETVDVSDIVADMPVGGSWNALRQQGRRDFTRTRVGVKPPTPAELDRIRQHSNGIVTCAPGQDWRLLRAIERKGYGVGVREDPRRPKLAYVQLNQRGYAAIAEQEVAA